MASATNGDLIAACEAVVPSIALLGRLWQNSATFSLRGPASLDELESWLSDRLAIVEIEAVMEEDARLDQELLGPKYVGAGTEFEELLVDLDWAGTLRDLVGRLAAPDLADRLLLLNVSALPPIRRLVDRWSEVEVTILDQFTDSGRTEIGVAFAPLVQTPLSFLGLGIEPPEPSGGTPAR